MAGFDALTKIQKTRAALHRDVKSICSETCHFLGLEITRPAMEVIAELVFKKMSIYGSDLEAFAKHAKRATINSEDVKLLVRRNPSLKQHLNTILPTPGSVTKEKRRKTVAVVTPRQDPPPKPTEESVIHSAQTRHKDTPEEDTPAKTKDDAVEVPTVKPDEFEDMVINDTIDLTFD